MRSALWSLLITLFVAFPARPQVGGDIQEFSLEDLLNTEVSAASKYTQKTTEAPASVSIITAEDIERFGWRTIGEVLQTLRGFYLSNDRNYQYVGVRGFSRPSDYNNRLLLLFNGHATNENYYGSASIGTDLAFDLNMVERIEVVRGPGSALYGTGAFFAVVNIVTKEGNFVDGATVSGEMGNSRRMNGAFLFGRRFDNGINLSVSGSGYSCDGEDLYFQAFDAPETNHGIAQSLDWDEYYQYYLRASYKSLSLEARMGSREKGIPTGPYEIAFNQSAWTLDRQGFAQIAFNPALTSNLRLQLRGYYDWYHYDGLYPYEDVDEDDVPYLYDVWERNDGRWMGTEVQMLYDLRSDNRLVAGAEFQKHLQADLKWGDDWDTYYAGDFPFEVFSFYVQDEWQMHEALSLTAGFRGDRYGDENSAFTPRFALVHHPRPSTSLKLLYGTAYRAPNVYELYYEDLEYDGFKTNPNLKPETIRTTELVWEQRLHPAVLAVLSLYDNRIEDLIDTSIDPADSLTQFQNISQARARGVEVGLQAKTRSGLVGYVNYSYQDAVSRPDDLRLSNAPEHLARAGVSYPLMRHIYGAVEMRYESERLSVYDDRTESYVVTNLNLSAPRLLDHLTLSLRVNNLFDRDYATPGGYEHLQPFIRQDGRTYIFRVDFSF